MRAWCWPIPITWALAERYRLVERLGGLHDFMRWDRVILTDSGGFQVFSLPGKQVDEQGVTFQFEQEGEKTRLTPEISMDIQRRLGADIVMAFDECVEHTAHRDYVANSITVPIAGCSAVPSVSWIRISIFSASSKAVPSWICVRVRPSRSVRSICRVMRLVGSALAKASSG